MAPPVLSVSVDLDEVACYHDIHGLDDGGREARTVWTTGVPRFLKLFERLEIKATFFVVGADLDPAVGAPALQQIAAAGHEVANHSHSHFYDLLRRGPSQRRDEVVRAAETIDAIIGKEPRGFRAPGYNIDDELIELLAELGYTYDASVFPCPSYYVAKAAALLAIRARGRQSRSLLGPKETLLAPTEPYVATKGFWKRQRRLVPRVLRRMAGQQLSPKGLVELPVAVLPGVRSPFIGTALALAGPTASAVMAHAMLARTFVGLELHGIDLLDLDDDGLDQLGHHQPDLRVPVVRKTACFEAAIRALARNGAQVMTCFEAARHLIAEGKV